MNINIRAKLKAQVYAGKFIEKQYTHTITLRSDDDLVILQMPLLESAPITEVYGDEALAELKNILFNLMERGLVMYPCVGTAFGIDWFDGELVLVTGYSSEGMETHEFSPTTIRDIVL